MEDNRSTPFYNGLAFVIFIALIVIAIASS